jgi:hypothetical protein
MLRRRLEPAPDDRLAALLGLPPAASTGLPSGPVSPASGWVPERSTLSSRALASPALSTPVLATSVPRHERKLAGNLGAAARTPEEQRAGVSNADRDGFNGIHGADGAKNRRPGRHRRPGPPLPAVLTVPLALRGVRARPRRLAVLGLMLLLAVVSILFGIRVALARSSAAPQPVAVSATGRPGGLVSRTVPAAFASTEPPATLAGAQATTAGVMVVHVVGQVRHEGVVRLPAGSRVLDAVRAAGGAKPSADLDHLNLARVVADGEQLVVPKPGETLSSASGSAGAGPAVRGRVHGWRLRPGSRGSQHRRRSRPRLVAWGRTCPLTADP